MRTSAGLVFVVSCEAVTLTCKVGKMTLCKQLWHMTTFPHSAGHGMVTKRINSMGTKNGHTVG